MAMFEGIASTQATFAGLRITKGAQDTSTSCLKLVLSFKPRAETTFKVVSKVGVSRQCLVEAVPSSERCL